MVDDEREIDLILILMIIYLRLIEKLFDNLIYSILNVVAAMGGGGNGEVVLILMLGSWAQSKLVMARAAKSSGVDYVYIS